MRQSGSPIIDPENINIEHYNLVSKGFWTFPDDFDPCGIDDYKKVYECTIGFLLTHTGSPTYLASLTSELEKYLQWTFRVASKSPFLQNEHDILSFFEFVKKPAPSWTSKSNQKRFIVDPKKGRIANSKWKPFREPRGETKNHGTIKKSYSCLKVFFQYALEKREIKVDPFVFIPKKTIIPNVLSSSKKGKKILLSEDRELLENTIEALAKHNEKYTRERFMILAMLNMYLRVSDLAEYRGIIPQMGDLYYLRSSGWWFHAYGKGNKQDDIPVNDRVINALMDYREHRGLSRLPYCSENTPLIATRNHKKAVTSKGHIAKIIQVTMQAAIKNATKMNWPQEDIDRLKSFTSHWLRHTGISDGVLSRPIDHVRRDARHVSLQTTSEYIDSDDRERHATA